ncbi:hypothetical protein F0562_008774 [Nyssa sinensis]|uniref:Suppressor of white apricot N-terminal domain-containing protein n=1 Tax=Nyssa sinensis TaxID=561372 RepID=A0A5J5AC08_9ASTE|nr:hypothetical protein F0562_008774 [Nyssa sinensis]
MDLALLFDDDAVAAFVNSSDALVEWNSLLIDRYDVRELLSSPPPPRSRRNPQQTHSTSSPPPVSLLESGLDHERYLDLPPESDEKDESAKLFSSILPYARKLASKPNARSRDGVLVT